MSVLLVTTTQSCMPRYSLFVGPFLVEISENYERGISVDITCLPKTKWPHVATFNGGFHQAKHRNVEIYKNIRYVKYIIISKCYEALGPNFFALMLQKNFLQQDIYVSVMF